MPRALTSGVSGMFNNQLTLDVAANNLANVNTNGFKGSRVNFSSALVQTQFSGTAPTSTIGGINPIQVGLGMQTSTVDVDMGQGSLQPTGKNLDLAIQGEGFFELTDGTVSSFTRVGNFGFDSNDNIIDLGTGQRLVGNTFNLETSSDGTQSIDQTNVALNIPRNEAFPPRRTDSVTFQGNLDSATETLHGQNLQSVFRLVSSLTGEVATDDTPLSELTIISDSASGLPGDTVTMYIFGTKPNGEAYAGSFEIEPWTVPTTANGKEGSVSDLVAQINNCLIQGSDRFATVRLDNGSLVATSTGSGDGFSMFIGERDPISGVTAFGADAVGNLNNTAGGGGGFNYVGTTTQVATGTVSADPQVGLLKPTFTMPAVDYSGQDPATLRVTVAVNGVTKGTITIPAEDYSAVGADLDFTLSNFPHVSNTDVITYTLSGSLDLGVGNQISWDTDIVNDTDDVNNLTADIDGAGGVGDGIPDMFQEGSTVDVENYVYHEETNTTFNWYRARFVPEVVNSSIQIFDAQGGSHNLDARFFKVGSRIDTDTGERINIWDMIAGITPGEGDIQDDVVAGIEFDQDGAFTGRFGSSPNGTVFGNNHVGGPESATIQIDWVTTGPTDPATMTMDMGDASGFNGLTGFGSASTAAAVDQTGYADGKLDNITVNSDGTMIGLYTNGINRKLAQLQLATFRNPQGLLQIGTNMFQQSINSGVVTRRTPGVQSGFITSGALEGSNVDIATEFTRIIIAQRGFQVNARIIQTSDQMLEELANLTR